MTANLAEVLQIETELVGGRRRYYIQQLPDVLIYPREFVADMLSAGILTMRHRDYLHLTVENCSAMYRITQVPDSRTHGEAVLEGWELLQ